ncbi:MAG: DUF4214 domain-containing protein, partial [Methylococcales bacterium]|nr:DUF4214 domain-containing protein [Methylococcales bacterium]
PEPTPEPAPEPTPEPVPEPTPEPAPEPAPTTLTPQKLSKSLIADIRLVLGNKSITAVNFVENFIESIPDKTLKFTTQKITLKQDDQKSLIEPFVIDGTNKADSQAIKTFVIDSSQLPTDKTLELKDVDFAVIKGSAMVKSGANDNFLYIDGDKIQQKIETGAGNDVTELEAGQHQLNGGIDIDKVKLSGRFEDYKIVKEFSKVTVINKTNPDDVKTLTNVEAIEFSDQAITIEYDAEINAIAGTYTQILGRQAATNGVKFWTDSVVNKGLSLGGMALFIMTSEEQQQKIGFDITQASVSTQVDQFFKSFLGRVPQAEGQKFWENTLKEGSLNLEDLATTLIESPEMQSHYLSPSQWDFFD